MQYNKAADRYHLDLFRRNVRWYLSALMCLFLNQSVQASVFTISGVNYQIINDVTAQFNAHRYLVIQANNTLINWFTANDAANKIGGHLVTITSSTEQSVINSLIASLDSTPLGYTDSQQEGVFRWITGESSGFTNWNRGEPNNSTGIEDHSAVFGGQNGSVFSLWNDIPGSINIFRHFIVEFDNPLTESLSIGEFTNQSVTYSLFNSTISASGALNQPSQVEITIRDLSGNQITKEVVSISAETNHTYTIKITLEPPIPNIIDVDVIATSNSGVVIPGQRLLIETDSSTVTGLGNFSEPNTGIDINVNGELAQATATAVEGRPTQRLTGNNTGGSASVTHTLTIDQERALCGGLGACVFRTGLNDQPTVRTVLADGRIQYQTTVVIGANADLDVTLGFDTQVGGAGVRQASSPSGAQAISTGNVTQTTLTEVIDPSFPAGEFLYTVAADQNGGDVTITFELPSLSEDQSRCGFISRCLIFENRLTQLNTQRQLLVDGRVRYATVVNLAPFEVRLFSLKLTDNQPPSFNGVSVSLNLLGPADQVSIQTVLLDQSGVLFVNCRIIRPDGSELILPMTLSNTVVNGIVQTVASVVFIPGQDPIGPLNGDYQVFLEATDLTGQTVATPIDQPAQIFTVDTLGPTIVLPASELATQTQRVIDGVPFASRNECVTFNATITDDLADLEQVEFIISHPDGSQSLVPLTQLLSGNGDFSGQLCIDLSIVPGTQTVNVRAVDRFGNVTVIPCDDFVVDETPSLASGLTATFIRNPVLATTDDQQLRLLFGQSSFGKLTVQGVDLSTNPATLNTIGPSQFARDGISDTDVILNGQNEPVVTFRDRDFAKRLSVFQLINNVWQPVGPRGFSQGTAQRPDLLRAQDQSVLVAYQDLALNGITVQRFDGQDWVNLGFAKVSDQAGEQPKLAQASDGTVYLIYRDFNAFGFAGATVKRFDDTTEQWVTVGARLFSQADVQDPQLVITAQGQLIAAFDDQNQGLRVMTFNANSQQWQGFAQEIVTPIDTVSLNLALDGSDNPVVAYQENNSQARTVVSHFRQGQFQTLRISAPQAKDPSLVVLGNQAYLAVVDGNQGNKGSIIQVTLDR